MLQHAVGIIRSSPDPRSPPRKSHNLDVRQRLSPSDHQYCVEALSTLASFIATVELFYLVPINLAEYDAAISEVTEAWADAPRRPDVARNVHLEINRRILNFLAAARTYLDHTETSLKRRHGDDSEMASSFKQQTAARYDSEFSYRFSYKLRNYAQHCGLPAQTIRFESNPSSSEQGQPKYSLLVAVSRDHILEAFDWGNLRREISSLPQLIDLTPILHGFMQALAKIHDHITEAELPFLRSTAAVIAQFGERIGVIDGDPCLLELEAAPSPTGEPDLTKLSAVRFIRLPVETASYIASRGFDGLAELAPPHKSEEEVAV